MNKFKQWVLNRKFVTDSVLPLLEEAKIQGSKDAFFKARKDLEEMMVETDKEKIEELANQKLNDLLSIIDYSQIITVDKVKKVVYIGGVLADAAKLSNLKAEAEFFEQSELWKIIHETPKELAQRTMFVSGDSIDDMKKGRSILYTLSTQKNILDTLKSYEQK